MQEPLVERVKLATHSLQSSGNGPLQCAQFSAHDRHDVVTCFGNVTASVDVVVVVLVVVVVVVVSVVVVVLYDELSVAEVLFCDVTVSDDDIMSDPEVVILSACCKAVVVVEVVVDVVVGAVVGGDVISVVTLAA